MNRTKVAQAVIIIILAGTLIVVTQFRSVQDIEIQDIKLEANGRTLVGLLARPKGEFQDFQLPAVAVFHGFTASKEMMRPFVEGLARHGFMVLAIDQQGHGLSSGDLGEDGENSLRNDGVAVVNYLRSRPLVDPSRIGILGHSMGAGTAMATSVNMKDIAATVLLGNSFGGLEDYKVNATFPQNVFMGIGKYDELFSVDDAKVSFGKLTGEESPRTDQVYGNFVDGSARELLVASTDHILEVINPKIVERSIEWMILSLIDSSRQEGDQGLDVDGNGYVIDQLLSFIAGLLLISLIPLFFTFYHGSKERVERDIPWFTHGLIGFAAFMVALPLGILVSFPAIFIGWYLIGFVLFSWRASKLDNSSLKQEIKDVFSRSHDLVPSTIALISIVVIVQIILNIVHWDFRYVIPLLGAFSIRRVGLFILLFIPGILYFTVEIDSLGGKKELNGGLYMIEGVARIWLFALLLCLHYIPIIFFQFTILPGIVGFLAFFIVGLLPVMLILSGISHVGRYFNYSPLALAIISSGIVAWLLAITLSFNA